MDYRAMSCIIIRKHGRYLQGKKMETNGLKWSWSAYDAWRTRDEDKARRLARIVGGVMVRFNPITNDRKVIGT